MASRKKFKKARKRGDVLVLINLGAPNIRDTGHGVSLVIPIGAEFGYEFVQVRTVPTLGFSTMMAEFRRTEAAAEDAAR
jgi:hypothetical protein